MLSPIDLQLLLVQMLTMCPPIKHNSSTTCICGKLLGVESSSLAKFHKQLHRADDEEGDGGCTHVAAEQGRDIQDQGDVGIAPPTGSQQEAGTLPAPAICIMSASILCGMHVHCLMLHPVDVD